MPVKMSLLERRHAHGLTKMLTLKPFTMERSCHVGFAQQLLKRQFPHLNGLQPTVLQAKKTLGVRKPLPNQLQVIHSRGNHWILASNIGCANGDVNIYDSVYSSVDKATIAVITQLFQSSAVKMVKSPKQKGGTDCGVFAIATATALAHGS